MQYLSASILDIILTLSSHIYSFPLSLIIYSDKNPADNTDLCYVDLERGNQTTGIDSAKGLIVLPEDNDNGEGAVHCHGLAWSNDVNDHTARYKANNLFFVSMYDHMYQRGYVENIPGAPMCGW